MRALDLGCGDDDTLWFPGAERCDNDNGDPRVRYKRTKDIPTGTFDLIWCRSAYGWNVDPKPLVKEITRIARKKATCILFETFASGTPSDQEAVKQALILFRRYGWNTQHNASSTRCKGCAYVAAIFVKGWE